MEELQRTKLKLKCYICGKEIKYEHFFVVKYYNRNQIMCRKCGVKFGDERRKKDADRQG